MDSSGSSQCIYSSCLVRNRSIGILKDGEKRLGAIEGMVDEGLIWWRKV